MGRILTDVPNLVSSCKADVPRRVDMFAYMADRGRAIEYGDVHYVVANF